MSVSKLTVLWSDPKDRRRMPVAHLWKDDEGFAFGYLPSLEAARKCGFELPLEFPDPKRTVEKPYRSPHLFATFFERIPSPGRPDYLKIVERWGVPETVSEKLAILAYSGGIGLGDRLEVAEHREIGEGLNTPLRVR